MASSKIVNGLLKEYQLPVIVLNEPTKLNINYGIIILDLMPKGNIKQQVVVLVDESWHHKA
jgi:hypothetical protein